MSNGNGHAVMDCQQKEVIEDIRSRLGSGDVTLGVIREKLDKILEQTTKTNGRVSKLEDGHRDFGMQMLKLSYTWKHVFRDVVGIIVVVAGAAGAVIQGVAILAKK